MSGRTIGLLLAVLATLALGACSAATDDADGGSTPSVPSSAPGTGTGTSVPVVDPADVEAFCALDAQLDQLTAEQLGDADPDDPDAFREDVAAFLADNDAVLDQYVAAAPAEIEADVVASMEQMEAAVDDPARFAEALARTPASDRVSSFVELNCR